MKVTNNTSFTVLAFGWRRGVEWSKGFSAKILILPGEVGEVNPPPDGQGAQEEDCVKAEVVCHESPDEHVGWEIALGKPIFADRGHYGVTIYHVDEPEIGRHIGCDHELPEQ